MKVGNVRPSLRVGPRFGFARLFVVALALLVSAACEESMGPGTDQTTTAIRLDVVGLGRVSERFSAEVAVLGDAAYTTTWSVRAGNPGNVVKIWNVASEVPALVDSLVIREADTTGDVQVSDDGSLLVVATERGDSGSIVIYGLDDPMRPTRLARHVSATTALAGVHTVKLGRVNGDLYAFLSVNPTNDVPAHLAVVDLTEPSAPEEVAAIEMGDPFVHDVFVRDGYLFTALWNDGLAIWDIGGAGLGGSPADPVEISRLKTVGSVDSTRSRAHNIWWYHDPDGAQRYVFVGEEGPSNLGAWSTGDIHVVDISDMEQPAEVAFFHVEGAGTHNFKMDEDAGLLYAAYYNGGVRVIDVTGDLSDCEETARAQDGRCDLRAAGREVAVALTSLSPLAVWGVALEGARVYASDMFSGLYVIDAAPVGETATH